MSKIRRKIIACLMVVLLGTSLIAVLPAQGAGSIQVTAIANGLQVSGSTSTPTSAVGVFVTQGERRVYINQFTSGADGGFSLTIPLAAGTYTVQASAAGQTFTPGTGTVVSGGSDPGPPPATTYQATISITGYRGTLLPDTVVSWQGRATVLSLLQQVAASRGLTVVVRNGYVAGINGQNEFDQGPTSGWKYRINGSVPGSGAGSRTVNDGDTIEWFYVEADDFDQAEVTGTEEAAALDLDLDEMITQTATYLKAYPLSDWGALGLLLTEQSGAQDYGAALTAAVQEAGGSVSRITEVERQILLAGALRLDPTALAGTDIVQLVYNSPDLTRQGTNGMAFGLLALDSCGAEIPDGALWDRERIISWLLTEQQSDGAWALTRGLPGDVDVTAMTVSALAPYRERAEVQRALDQAVAWLAAAQLRSGGFSSMGVENNESSSQVIVALCSLGISPEDDRFVKPGGSLLDRWAQYQQPDGGFAHEPGQASNPTATEQALLALAACRHYQQGQPPIYVFDSAGEGIFADSAWISSWARPSVERAFEMGIIKGTQTAPLRFTPGQAVSRAELVAMLSRMQLPVAAAGQPPYFQDVTAGAWYYDSVQSAAQAGWITGTGGNRFEPQQAITRQDLAMILVRTYPDLTGDTFTGFKDLGQAYPAAREAIGKVAGAGLMRGDDNNFHPYDRVTREMAATILVRLHDIVEQAEP